MIDIPLITTLILIAALLLAAAYRRSTRRDRCLSDFDHFQVTVERKDGRLLSGVMQVYATGIALARPAEDSQLPETSSILYGSEYGDLQVIYRYVRGLSAADRERRQRSIEHLFRPTRRWRARRIRQNVLDSAADFLSDLVNPTRRGLNGQQSATLGPAGARFDPLLERHLGKQVVVQVAERGELHEHIGILKDYSATFLEILDVYYPRPYQVRLPADSQYSLDERVRVVAEGRQLRVHNDGDQPVLVERIALGNQRRELSAIVDSGGEIALYLDSAQAEIALDLRLACRLDMIAPRSHALIRHQAGRYDSDIIFDVGLSLTPNADRQEEEKLRQTLRYTPHDAEAAARLGELLYRQRRFDEARAWLAQALEHRRHLLDDGRRVAQNLRLLERRGSGLNGAAGDAPNAAALPVDANSR